MRHTKSVVVRRTRSGRAWASLAAAMAAAVPAVGHAQVDQFEFLFNNSVSTGGTAMGGFAYDALSNTFYTGGFSGASQGIRKITNTGGVWSAQIQAGQTDWVAKFLASSSVSDNGGNGTIPPITFTSASTIGDMLLNPATITIGGIAYAPGTVAIIIDQATVRDTNNGNLEVPSLSKQVYAYDLRQVGAAVAPGSRDRNSNGTVDWNDVFEPLFTMQDFQTAQGTTSTGISNARRFAFSSTGQSIYLNDISSTFGGIWRVNLTGSGAGALTKVVDSFASPRINSEPAVIPTGVRDLANGSAGAGDQVIFQGSADSGNLGGISYVVDNGTTATAPQTLLKANQLASFFDVPGADTDAGSITADAAGNLYFMQTGSPAGLFVYDTQGRLAKVSSHAEKMAFDRANGATANNTQVLDTKVRDVTVNLTGGGTAVLPQVLFNDAATGVRTVVGVTAYKAGDFNRDNLVDAGDIALFKGKLGLRGAVLASQGTTAPFTGVNTADLKFDLNGSNTVANIAGVSIDWKDARIFQQFAGLQHIDVDMDFDVDGADFDAVAVNYGSGGKLFTQGNLTSVRIDAPDRDSVNYADLITLAANWTNPVPALGGYAAAFQADADRTFAITTGGTRSQYVDADGGAGAWSAPAGWSDGAVPNAPGAIASLLTKPFDDVAIDIDGSFTVGQINFDSFFAYTLAGGGTLHLNNNGAKAELNAFAASPTIAAKLALDADTDFNVMYAADTMRLSGEVSGSGDLVKSGAGRVLVSGVNLYTGATIVNGGTLQTVRPANLPGWDVVGKVTVNSGGTLAVSAGGTGEWLSSQLDILRAATTFNAGSALGIDTTNGGANLLLSGNIAGPQGLTKSGPNKLTLGGSNTYGGATAVNGGTLEVASPAALPGFNTPGKVSVAAGATLIVRAGGSAFSAADLQSLVANATFAAGLTLVTGATLGVDTTPAGAGGAVVYNSVIPGAGIGLTKLGANTLTLTRANTFTGATTVAGGTLGLDFSAAGAPTSNIIATTSVLRLAGGTLTLSGKPSTSNAQTVASAQIQPGASYVELIAAPTANPLALTLGSLSRLAGGTLDVTPPSGTPGTTNGVTTTTTITAANNGIFGGHLTVGKTDWATRTGAGAAPVIALPAAGYTADTWGSSTNTTVTASGAPAAGSTTNSLRFNAAGAHTITLDGSNTLTSGGILITPNVGASDVTITGGTLIGRANADLVVHQHNGGGTMTITSALADHPSGPTGLTKSGTGRLIVGGGGGALAYTGATTINEGVVALQADLTTSSSVSVNGSATLELRDGSAAGALRVIKTPTLAVADGARLDLTDNVLVTAARTGNWNGNAYTGIAGLVDAGRGGAGDALWDGNGVVTTDARAIANGDLVSIGVLRASDKFRTGGGAPIVDTATATFAGQTVLGSDTLVMVTWGGDANLDGTINIDDYGLIDSNVSKSGTAFGWVSGDFNYDGKINIDDYGIIDGNIGRQTGTFPTAGAAALDGVAAVPEPSTFAFVCAGACGMLLRRRRVAGDGRSDGGRSDGGRSDGGRSDGGARSSLIGDP